MATYRDRFEVMLLGHRAYDVLGDDLRVAAGLRSSFAGRSRPMISGDLVV